MRTSSCPRPRVRRSARAHPAADVAPEPLDGTRLDLAGVRQPDDVVSRFEFLAPRTRRVPDRISDLCPQPLILSAWLTSSVPFGQRRERARFVEVVTDGHPAADVVRVLVATLSLDG